jgi:hypothetical protein
VRHFGPIVVKSAKSNQKASPMKSNLLALRAVLFLFVSTFLGQTAAAQCTFNMPPSPGHVKILTNQSLNAVGTVYWICEGLTVNITASPGSVYVLEQNVTLNINNSDGDQVFAKAGCVINNNTPEDIGVTVNPSNVTLNNNSTGSITITSNCTSVIYDYSMAGGGPCIGNTSVKENVTLEMKLFPNPVFRGADLFIESGPVKIDEVNIYDLAGKLVFADKKSISPLHTETLLPGFYIIEIKSGGNTGRSQLIVL